MTGPAPMHPLAVLLAGMIAAFETELARQDGDRVDLPPLGSRKRGRGDLTELLEAKRKKRPRADRRAPNAA